MTTEAARRSGFHHEALFYAGDDEFLAGTIPFVEQGVDGGDKVLVILPEPRLRLVRDALGPAAEEVGFLAMEREGRNPARLVSTCGDLLRDREPGQGARGLGEPIWAGRSAAEVDECERHEVLLNLAFGEEQRASLALMCSYDAGSLADEVLVQAQRSHLHCSGRDDGLPSAPFAPGDPLQGSLPERGAPAASLDFGRSDLRMVRRAVTDLARSAGLSQRRNEDLVFAVCEVATNSIQHGGGGGCLAVWRDGGELVCDLRDGGRIEDPLVGRERPPADQVAGRGLWIVNQLCDLVQIRSGEQGTHVRLRMAIQP